MNEMVKIYEEIIEKQIENVEEVELWICEELQNNSVKFEKRIEERYDSEMLTRDKYIMVYVAKENIEKIKEFIEPELLLTTKIERNFTENQIDELNDYDAEDERTEKFETEDVFFTFEDNLKKLNKKEHFWTRISKIAQGIFLFLAIVVFIAGVCEVSDPKVLLFDFNSPIVINTLLLLLFSLFFWVMIEGSTYLYVKKVSRTFIRNVTKKLLKDYKYSENGISKKFFFKHEFTSEYRFLKFSSSDKISSEIDEKEFVLSNLCLEQNPLFASRYSSNIVFKGIFLKGKNSKFFNNHIEIKEKNVYETSWDNDEETELNIDKMNDEEIYKIFDEVCEILVEGEVHDSREFDIRFIREFFKLYEFGEVSIEAFHLIADTFCIMLRDIDTLIEYRDIKENKITNCDDMKKIEEVFLKNINEIKKYYSVALLFKYKE